MKVLLYFWTKYNDKIHSGGGVKVYLNNLVSFYSKRKNIEVYALDSGTEYDLSKKLKIKQRRTEYDNVKMFSIVNSPIIAPACFSFYQMHEYLNDSTVKDLLMQFIEDNGPFDVVHFQSFEGLPISVLELKEKFVKTQFIISVHNYHYFCPQVNLWKYETVKCDNYEHGKCCLNCINDFPNINRVKLYYGLVGALNLFGLGSSAMKFKSYLRKIKNNIKKTNTSDNSSKMEIDYNYELFESFRLKNVEYINKYIDKVLCVSGRVEKIVQQMGIDSKKTKVCYIGTRFAEKTKNDVLNPYSSGVFTVAYMGYMRKDKGFFFLIDALEKLPEKLCKSISIVIAAKFDNTQLIDRINQLKNKYHSVILYDGYTHANMCNILQNVNLGVIPVQWEDCLPQVAIEMRSFGIPILVSNLGGAQELANDDDFVFNYDAYDDFKNKLEYIINNPQSLHEYFKEAKELVSMDEHINELLSIYLK